MRDVLLKMCMVAPEVCQVWDVARQIEDEVDSLQKQELEEDLKQKQISAQHHVASGPTPPTLIVEHNLIRATVSLVSAAHLSFLDVSLL